MANMIRMIRRGLSGPLRSTLRPELGRTAHRQVLRKTSLLEEDKGDELRAASKSSARPSNARGPWLGGGPRPSGRFLCSCVFGIRVRASF